MPLWLIRTSTTLPQLPYQARGQTRSIGLIALNSLAIQRNWIPELVALLILGYRSTMIQL